MIGFNLTEEQKEMQAFYRKFSQERVKAAAEKMEATEEDFEAEIKSIAESYQMEADKVRELLGEQGAKQVKEDICVRKAADFIVDNAKEAKAAAKKTTKKEKAAEEKPEEA